MSEETAPVIMRVTTIYEYPLEPDLARRQECYGTTDPDACAAVDATGDPIELIELAELKHLEIVPVTVVAAGR